MARGLLFFLVTTVLGFSVGFNIKPTFLKRSSSLIYSSSKLGTPSEKPLDGKYQTNGQILVDCEITSIKDPLIEIEHLVSSLDDTKGLLLTSSYEYPGRYARWTVGFLSPPIQIEGTGLDFSISALNSRGKVILKIIEDHLLSYDKLFALNLIDETTLSGKVIPSSRYFNEEERSQQPSLFSLVRAIRDLFSSEQLGQLGLYGAFGYDLAFQFEPIKLSKSRPDDQRDLLLYLPDEIIVVDKYRSDSWKVQFDFSKNGLSTRGIPRSPCESKFIPTTASETFEERDTAQNQYSKNVIAAKEQFRLGNLFEVVLSQVFRAKLVDRPSDIFARLLKRNPSPYGFFVNLGRNEYLVGASPEMFVRVEKNEKGLRVETCPISGTIERGSDPLEDALQIKKLLMNAKEESELTMCTDVDRNDKSRICEAGTIRVLGRRQIEMYSKLIHTVDHVEGYLRKEFDALDALLCHTWAVTVTGAPKTWAIRFVEETEKSVRHWYGGAVGLIGFDGSLNTGLTLRTIRVKNGIGEVRAGATLLYDSDPDAEEKETELKASAMIEALTNKPRPNAISSASVSVGSDSKLESEVQARVLLVDHEDSFVHTLADYLRQTGAEVATCRCGESLHDFFKYKVDTGIFKPTLVVLSPGPGNPSDFKLSDTISFMINKKIPMFGVCLGLQGLVEYFGGKLSILSTPMHGKSSVIRRVGNMKNKHDVLSGLPQEFQVGRYHSLHGESSSIRDLVVTAQSSDGVIMALCHEKLPIAAVQFHPESILTLPKTGLKILRNAIDILKSDAYD